jgi:hypothetical protein
MHKPLAAGSLLFATLLAVAAARLVGFRERHFGVSGKRGGEPLAIYLACVALGSPPTN